MLSYALTLMLCAQAPPDSSQAFGPRIDLGEAILFFPKDYRLEDGRIDLAMHLHGAETTVQSAMTRCGWRGALLVFNRPGLSAVYTRPFSDPTLFPRLLVKVEAAAKAEKHHADPKIGRVIVSSFSAGFGGVREMLKSPDIYDRIDGLVLADSLYCGYEGPPANHKLEDSKMADFRRFARDAAAGKKILVVSHSSQIPDGYGSTTETAEDLIAHVGGRPEVVNEDRGDGWKQALRFARGRFLVLGFEGKEGPDHLRHLRRLGEIWQAMPELAQPTR